MLNKGRRTLRTNESAAAGEDICTVWGRSAESWNKLTRILANIMLMSQIYRNARMARRIRERMQAGKASGCRQTGQGVVVWRCLPVVGPGRVMSEHAHATRGGSHTSRLLRAFRFFEKTTWPSDPDANLSPSSLSPNENLINPALPSGPRTPPGYLTVESFAQEASGILDCGCHCSRNTWRACKAMSHTSFRPVALR